MVAQTSKLANIVSRSAMLGVALLLGVGNAGVVQAQIQIDPSRVRIPEPQQSEPQTQTPSDTPTAANARFTCEVVDGEQTVMYHPENQNGQSYEWAKPRAMGGGWSEDRRCAEIARRLESYRPDGLQELRTGMENNYDVICVTSEKNPDCRIVLTVPPGEDPVAMRDRVFQNLTVADSGQQTDAVNALIDGGNNPLGKVGEVLGGGNGARPRSGNGIDLRPFLAPSDGGTGAFLGSSAPSSSNPSLDPDKYR